MADPHGLPPAFDADHYLAANPDLAITRGEAAGHYENVGRADGRVASPLALRENLIKLIDDGRSVLEIGPFCDPLLRGPNVAYLDVLDADQLRARAREIGKDPAQCPAWIDYVGGLEQVRRRFDAVISSHAIEHNPDLIQHLEQIERILEPDGLFCLIIPDKRYCFDHYIAESTIAGVLQAHRDRRSTHSLASVIEHVALTTHNDSARHWVGDHGPRVPPDRVQRLRNAISAFDTSGGGYLDVHAWYFTPDSFAEIIEALEALNLTGLEVAGIYDSARGRNEFCAVLRLTPAARERAIRRAGGGDVIVLQTADADRYAPMLAITAPNVREYCRRHGLGYESFVGIKRGFHPWQATFNRIPMLAELVERGFSGWALYLDADAWIQDLDFDLAAYLADKQDRAAIFATSGVTGEAWDVNAGVVLINLGHPLGRRLIAEWANGFAQHSDDDLRQGEEWFGAGNDQALLHEILQRGEMLAEAVLVEQMSFINGPHASFIRQQLRTLSPTFEQRLQALSSAVADVFRRKGRVIAQMSAHEERWTARLAHRDAQSLALVEARIPASRPDLLASIIDAWKVAPKLTEIDQLWIDFTDALERGDTDAVAAELTSLGRSPIAQGFLGGARQHERARDPVFAERLARWTYDKLLSLAEAVGAVRLENPENGPWGLLAQRDPAQLFEDIEKALGVDLSPPASIGGYLGIEVGGGRIVHMRMLDGIHAAWRLSQIAPMIGLGMDARIAEIGGGAGFTAYYAVRLGLTGYCLFDRSAMNAVQAYVLGAARGHSAKIMCGDTFAHLPDGSMDILFNADSLPDMLWGEATGLIADAQRIGVRHIVSINQEAVLPGKTAVGDVIRASGAYRLASRHRHWLRAGYVEEHYMRSHAGEAEFN